MVRVKICGLTCPEQARATAQAGADAIGLVFYPASPRNVTAANAQAICQAIPPFVTTVGLFVDPDPDFVTALLAQVPLDLLQFHGAETERFCSQFGRPYIKAIRMEPNIDLMVQCQTFHSSRGILLDTFIPGTPGGTGQAFDWSLIPQALTKPVILAGGLTASNVGDAIRQVRPWAVDVSGGVEVSKGKKDPDLVKAFIRGVHGVSN